MKSTITLPLGIFAVDLTKPIDISLPLTADTKNPNAWYLGKPEIEPVKSGDWIGKVSEGAKINFNHIKFSPHAHGTHTECYGHISTEFYSVAEALTQFFFKAKLISVRPKRQGEDRVLTKAILEEQFRGQTVEALIIRSLPNEDAKQHTNYDHTNWPYLTPEAAAYLRDCGIAHLLIDLPSVDREEGDVLAHKAFWNYPDHPRKNATITEFIYVPSDVKDGDYLLNLQVAHFDNDAAPSRPVLFEIESGK